MSSVEGIENCKYRIVILTVLSVLIYYCTYAFSGMISTDVIPLVQGFGIFPAALGIADILTVRSRDDKRNLLVVLGAVIGSTLLSTWTSVNQSFGQSKSVTIDEVLIDSCDNHGCTHTGHRGVEITYENDYLLFGVSRKENSVHTRQYCNSCLNNPTFEIEEAWGRDPIVVERFNRYYTEK